MSSCPVAASCGATVAIFVLGFLRSRFPVMTNPHQLRLTRLQLVVHLNLAAATVDDSRRPGWTLLTHMDNRMFEQSVVYLLCVCVRVCFLLRQLFRPPIIIWKRREMSVSISCTLGPLFACTQNIAFYAHT